MKGRLLIELRNREGKVVERQTVENAVMQGGGEMIARLFSGQGFPISHMGVGTSDMEEPDSFDTTALINDENSDYGSLSGETEVALPPQSFAIEHNAEKRVYTVKVRGTLPAAAAVGMIREAGLIAKNESTSVLYNRVIFAPMSKGDDHELTMFWEVSFPYGDLQWY
ncbi:hypothetical protein [Desulfobacterium sp. N47]|uniref:Heme-binding protein n=1 Tax=uncultured Desulfobacterium sp. TaxID=201089 RepID=E1YEL3_9BACT|nr:hypothetical protein N47_P17120 [uncultured Desulfobacterium sp.]